MVDPIMLFSLLSFSGLTGILTALSADIVLKDKAVVYDLANQRVGWVNYDCKCFLNPLWTCLVLIFDLLCLATHVFEI